MWGEETLEIEAYNKLQIVNVKRVLGFGRWELECMSKVNSRP